MVRQPAQAFARAELRERNRRVVVNLVQQSGPVSRATIARVTRLAKPTVSLIVDELASEGVLREIGVGEASHSGGRRPVLFDFNQQSHHVLAVHIGVEITTVVLADAIGIEVAQAEVVTPHESPETMLASVAEAAGRLFSKHSVNRRSVTAIGVCVPALVDPVAGVLVLAPNLGWRNVNIREGLRAINDSAAIYVHNVAQAVLAAEYTEGAAQKWPNAVLLYEDSGVGAALMVDGSIFHGVQGFAGEIGHCKLPGAEEPCNCGARCCLETLVSASAVLRRAGHRPVHDGTLRHQLRALAQSDDPRVNRLLREVGSELGTAASWLVNLVNPDAVIISGGFLDAGEHLFDGFVGSLRDHALPEAGATLNIERSALGGTAPIRGATLLALQASQQSVRSVWGPSRPSLPASDQLVEPAHVLSSR